jgi:hypothetical protein
MIYVEWLRIRNCLRVLAIVLGVLLVIALVVRISLRNEFGSDEALVRHFSGEPGTIVSHSVVNGMSRTTMVNPREHVTITIDDRPDGGRTIHITEPAHSRPRGEHDTFGSVSISTSESGATQTTQINTNGPTPFEIYLAGAALTGVIIATILACAFARENDGHLEIALLRPISRVRYALGVIGADLAAIVLAEILTIVAMVIAQAMFEVPHFGFNALTPEFVVMALIGPFAWYAMINAATASLKRGSGAVLGFSWPVALIVVAFAHAPASDAPILQAIHAICWTISRIIPLTYTSFQFNDNGAMTSAEGPFAFRAGMLCLLLLVYGALTVVQWRRVEA